MVPDADQAHAVTMRSLISEFSYGFALTHELVLSLGTLSAAPIFPSLLQEGGPGGGYDLKLEAPGLPLFLQFKRSDHLSRRTAREIKAGAPLTVPFYRFEITGRSQSEQHDMLVGLDVDPNVVLYAAPLFHRKAEFDDAFLRHVVRQRSFYVRPRDIGVLADDDAHRLSFDGRRYVVMSEPREVKGFGATELEKLLADRLAAEKRPVRAVIGEALREAEMARIRSRDRVRRRAEADEEIESSLPVQARSVPDAGSRLDAFVRRQERDLPTDPEPTTGTPDDPATAELRRLADIGLREFDAQLYIVQLRAEG